MIKDLIPVACNIKIDRRLLINAVFYLTKTGCQWRQLPKDFPKWKAVYSFFERMRRGRNIWEKIMDRLVLYSREKLRCIEEPRYAIVDSRSTKTHNRFEEIGFDGYKKNKRYKSPTS